MRLVLIGVGFGLLVIAAWALIASSKEVRNQDEKRRLRGSSVAFTIGAVSCFVLSSVF